MPEYTLNEVVYLYREGLITYEEARKELGFHPVANADVMPDEGQRYHG